MQTLFRAVSPEYTKNVTKRGMRAALRTVYLNTFSSPRFRIVKSAAYESTLESYGGSYLYDQLYPECPVLLSRLVEICQGSTTPVLLLGGGTGREAAALVQSGFECVMFENSPTMIASAQKRFEKLSAVERRRLTLIPEDLRTLQKLGAFDRVLAPGGPLTFLGSEAETLNHFKKIEDNLSPRGLFYFDVFSIDYWASRSALGKGIWQYWFTSEDRFHLWIQSQIGPYPSSFRFQKVVKTPRKNHVKSQFDLVNLYSLKKWSDILTSAGLWCAGIAPNWYQPLRKFEPHLTFPNDNLPVLGIEKILHK